MKAEALLKHNIVALLKARKQQPHDLAQWCRRSDAWLSKILGKDNRNLPLEYLDRMADFFGLAAYELFRPGITPLLERRKGDRRSGRDRRVHGASGLVREAVAEVAGKLTPVDVADLIALRLLSHESRAEIRRRVDTLQRSEQPNTGRRPGRRGAGTVPSAPTKRATRDDRQPR